jgi:hypothetical protein
LAFVVGEWLMGKPDWKKNKFFCPLCDRRFKSTKRVVFHIHAEHAKFCWCEKFFMSPYDFWQHILDKGGVIPHFLESSLGGES